MSEIKTATGSSKPNTRAALELAESPFNTEEPIRFRFPVFSFAPQAPNPTKSPDL
jgi:hypothetical protein